jgi:phosphatidate cytidylyltransferase
MKVRVGIGTLLVAAVAGVYLLDTRLLEQALATRILVWLLALGALYEVIALGAKKVEVNPGLFFYGGVALVAVVVPSLVAGKPVPAALLALAAMVGGGIRFLGMARLRSAAAAFPEAVLLAVAILYTGGLLAFLDRILIESIATAFCVVAISKVNDICGYLVGSSIGKQRIAPAISPKKTWAGTIAGFLGAGVLGYLLSPWLAGPPFFAALIGMLIGLASFLGDLIASGVKRWSGVKDSSALLPEYGGFLDLLDGILLAAPVAVVCLHGS